MDYQINIFTFKTKHATILKRRGYKKMTNFKYIRTAILLLACATFLTTSNLYTEIATAEPVTQQAQVVQVEDNYTKPLDIVKSPKEYLNKTVTMKARFDKFSTLGLDYKSAFKSSEEYISFLIKRDDTEHDIPLSEMKLFLKRAVAEKNIELKSNDVISITGTVFSAALGDPWIDVTELTVLKKADNDKTKDGVK